MDQQTHSLKMYSRKPVWPILGGVLVLILIVAAPIANFILVLKKLMENNSDVPTTTMQTFGETTLQSDATLTLENTTFRKSETSTLQPVTLSGITMTRNDTTTFGETTLQPNATSTRENTTLQKSSQPTTPTSVTMTRNDTTARIFKDKIFIERAGYVFEMNQDETNAFLQVISLCLHWKTCAPPGKEKCQPIGNRGMKICQDEKGKLTGVTYQDQPFLSSRYTIDLFMWATKVLYESLF